MLRLDIPYSGLQSPRVHLTDHQQYRLCRQLLDWFDRHRRDLPWRKRSDPYAVWVSEIMLQQTQVDRAISFFIRWMQRFPTISSLAAAPQDEVLRYWEGLGYYSRARNMHRTARVVMRDHHGELPRDHALLRSLPGIGPYTAGAIASIAYNQPLPAVDANVERVLARLLDIDQPVKTRGAAETIRAAVLRLIPPDRAGDFNQALMELGALCCRSRSPSCSDCPIGEHCEALRLGIVLERPVPGRKVAVTPLEIVTGVLVHKGKVFIQKRPPDRVWGNLWEFPGGRVEEREHPRDAAAREFLEETELEVTNLEKITVIRHGYTRYRVNLHCFLCSLGNCSTQPVLHAAQKHRWALPAELDALAFPAAHRKLIDILARDMRFHSRLESSHPGAC